MAGCGNTLFASLPHLSQRINVDESITQQERDGEKNGNRSENVSLLKSAKI